MPRPLPTALITHLQGSTLTLALCVSLTRADGVTLGLTKHDLDLTFGSPAVTYRANGGMSCTNLRATAGTGADNLEVSGVQAPDALVEADLRAGRYDGAGAWLGFVNWADLSMGAGTLLTGTCGQVLYKDGAWTFEVMSLAKRLQQQVVKQFSPTCRVLQLGDSECRVSLPGYQFARTVTGVTSDTHLVFGGDAHPANYYAFGRVIWLSGANVGAPPSEVKSSAPDVGSGAVAVVLRETPLSPVSVGDTATLEKGCDRTLTPVTGCQSFADPDDASYPGGNVRNFRGEPYVPASDRMIQRAGYAPASGLLPQTQFKVVVAAVVDTVTFDVSNADGSAGDVAAQPAGFFTGGLCFWTSGPNAGVGLFLTTDNAQPIAFSASDGQIVTAPDGTTSVLSADGTRVVLGSAPPFTVSVGDTATLQTAS